MTKVRTESSPESSAESSRVIAALIAGVLIYGLAMGTTYPLLGVVLSDQVTGALNGFNAGATGLGLLLGVAAMPWVARRVGAGMTMLVGIAVMAASLTALALSRDFWLIFAARLALGVGANFMFVVVETALNVFSPSGRRGRIMGFYSAAVAFGFVTGPAVVAAVPDAPLPILLGCAAMTALALLPLRRARRPVDAEVRPVPARRMGAIVLGFPFPFGILFIASAVDAVAISLLPIITLNQGFPVAEGALFVTVFHVGLLVGQPLVGSALDALGRQRTVIACCAASLACTLLLAFSGLIGFWLVAGLMFVWGGVNYGLYTAGLALIGDRFTDHSLTAATAAFAAVYAAASIFSPLVAGSSTDLLGAAGFYFFLAGIYLTAAVVGAVVFRPLEPTLESKVVKDRCA